MPGVKRCCFAPPGFHTFGPYCPGVSASILAKNCHVGLRFVHQHAAYTLIEVSFWSGASASAALQSDDSCCPAFQLAKHLNSTAKLETFHANPRMRLMCCRGCVAFAAGQTRFPCCPFYSQRPEAGQLYPAHNEISYDGKTIYTATRSFCLARRAGRLLRRQVERRRSELALSGNGKLPAVISLLPRTNVLCGLCGAGRP